MPAPFYKDTNLAELALRGYNIARFVSFSPDGEIRRQMIRQHAEKKETPREAIRFLFKNSPTKLVNVRTFQPEKPKGNPFFSKFSTVDEVLDVINNKTLGLYTIANEFIEPNDGGINGVILSNLVEFGTGHTPRNVELKGAAQLHVSLFSSLVKIVYNAYLDIPFGKNNRVEFSVHPNKEGFLQTHTIVWENEEIGKQSEQEIDIRWPNRYSHLLGDKTYGLLVAWLLGLQVPYTTVISRKLPPFSFGQKHGNFETGWIRTAPASQTPGKFTTVKGWIDPYKLLQTEDPTGNLISSVLYQSGVSAVQAGACIPSTNENEQYIIEAANGVGDQFMVGSTGKVELLPETKWAVEAVRERIVQKLGSDVAFEWSFDGNVAWIMQLHRKTAVSSSKFVYYAGEPSEWLVYDASCGLEGLRDLTELYKGSTKGIIVRGQVGVTSHFGDVLRQAKITSKIE